MFFTFSFLSSIYAQSNCPTISVTSPNSITPIGDSMTFTANLSGGSYDKINYEWIISSGTLMKGQNTSSITIATNADLAGQTITATVKITGLPQECKNEVSESGEVAAAKPPVIWETKVAEYGKIPWNDERVRIDIVGVELKNDNELVAYFIVRNKSKKRSQVLKQREAKMQKYFFEAYKIAKNRIIFIGGGNGNDNTVVHILDLLRN